MKEQDSTPWYYEEERRIFEILDMIQLQYERAAKPYIDRLAELQRLKPAPPTIVTTERAIKLGLIPKK